MLRQLVLISVAAAVFSSSRLASAQSQGYYGKFIGKLKTFHHKVSGEVYAVDARTLHIRDFYYDGEGPAAYFYAGNSKNPGSSGFRIHDERGSANPLRSYQKKHVTITLPDGKNLNNIKWFSVWCEEFSVNFGDVKIPKNLDYPKPQKIDPLNGVHQVSSEAIIVVDAQTLLIPGFSYDGEAPDAKFWVGRGSKPSPQGIRVPDENGKENPLRRYDQKTIVLTLPGETTIFDIGHFGVWCEAFAVDFGHVRIPRGLNVPPSLKMLGVAPQSKLNCEVLWDDLAFEVRWAVAGDSIVLQLVSKLDDGEYMSFGLSGDDSRSKMIGGDVVVAWVEKDTLKGYAQDYFLDAKSQCAGTHGSCPDERLQDNTNNVRLLNAAMVNGYSIITYQRPLKAQDELDRNIITNGSQPIIWALGPLNSRNEVSYHSITNKGDVFLEFGRSPKWNCPIPETDSSSAASSAASKPSSGKEAVTTTTARPRHRPQATPAPAPKNNAWEIPPIQCYEPEDGVFYAQMGPTGGKHGYPAITGHVGWGISWYINGLLIPEINVVRGKTYTFVVEGGLDPDIPAKYHPFYITDDPVGGYEHKTPEERAEVKIFAGARRNNRGDVYPTGTGRLCNWTPDPNQPPADEFASFGAYQRTLTLECDSGEPGVVQWTPDRNTPNTVYYQCFTHRYLGWKINVLDSCDTATAGSENIPVRIPVKEEEEEDEDDEEGELQGRPSIQVSTQVKPNAAFFSKDKQENKYIPLSEFPQLPANTQQNFLQEFPFSYEPVTTEATVPDDSSIRDAYVPPPVLLQENTTTIQDQAFNSSNESPVAQSLIQEYPQVVSLKLEPSPATPDSQQTETRIQFPLVNMMPSSGTKTVSSQQHNHSQATKATSNFTPPDKIPAQETNPGSEPQVAASSALNISIEHTPYPTETKPKIPLSAMNKPGLIPGKMNLHSAIMPQVYGRIPVYQRPMLPYYARPVPQRGFTRQPPAMYRPQFMNAAASNHHNYVIKKPFYRPLPKRPIGPMGPQFHRPMTKPHIPMQHTATSIKSYQYTLPPYNHAVKFRKILSTTTTTATSTSTKAPPPAPTQPTEVVQVDNTAAIKPSPPILPSDVIVLNGRDSLNIPVAINTGFNPHSVVVEGGFKPIIASKNAAAPQQAQDRSSTVSEGEEEDDLLKEETEVEKTEEAKIANLPSEDATEINQEERKEDLFQGQQPETFEPMFIPSPPDRQNGTKIKKPVLVEDLAPPPAHIRRQNGPHSNRKNGHPLVMIRPRPGLVRRPLFPNNIVPPFHIRGSPTFRYQHPEEFLLDDESAIKAEPTDIHYHPPRANSPPDVDGKIELAALLGVKNVRSPFGTEDPVKDNPQFLHYKEIPENILQLKKQNHQQTDSFADSPPIRNTQFAGDEQDSDDSDTKELTTQGKFNKGVKQGTKKAVSSKEDGKTTSAINDNNEDGQDMSTVPTVETEGTSTQQVESRVKRSAHHEPGHEGHDDDHHHDSHPEAKDTRAGNESRSLASKVLFSSAFLILCIVVNMYLQ